jgi:uncharacterized membrane protein
MIWGLMLFTLGIALLRNPLIDGRPMTGLPPLDLITLGFGLPTAAAWIGAVLARRHPRPMLNLSGLLAVTAIAFGGLWLVLIVRRAFQGPVLAGGAIGTTEWWTYSAAGAAFGGLLLILGILTSRRIPRYASLAVILLTAVKVFLIDANALDGLLRVLSFLGLGVTLLLIGYVYQRWILGPELTAEPSPATPRAEGDVRDF